ncbi:hypothetical protein ACVI1L_004694 [Bradyrhizobium sp. USDA 4516]
MPALDESARRQTISAALAGAASNPDAERIQLPWRGSQIMATVVRVPLDAVVLNPRSHRIRSQLESNTEAALVSSVPFEPRAQSIITEILRTTDKFDDLKANLRDVGQTDPGVVSVAGLLVNANTRCVALRDINARDIRVAVLPDDATDEDIDRLELNLQMVRDFRRDYTFTNELLFIEELVTRYHYTPINIATEMNWVSRTDAAATRRAEEEVQTRLRMLAIIRELQAMGANRLRLVEFDAMRQAISELDSEFERINAIDPMEAQRVKDMRLTGLLANVGYRELREIKEGFLDEFLLPALEEQSLFQDRIDDLTRPMVADTASIPGLDVLDGLVPTASSGTRSAEMLLSLMASSIGKDTVLLPANGSGSIEVSRPQFLDEFKQAVEGAAEDARQERTKGDRIDRPRLLIRKASKQIRSAMEALAQVRSSPEFDDAKLLAAVSDHVAACDALQKALEL